MSSTPTRPESRPESRTVRNPFWSRNYTHASPPETPRPSSLPRHDFSPRTRALPGLEMKRPAHVSQGSPPPRPGRRNWLARGWASPTSAPIGPRQLSRPRRRPCLASCLSNDWHVCLCDCLDRKTVCRCIFSRHQTISNTRPVNCPSSHHLHTVPHLAVRSHPPSLCPPPPPPDLRHHQSPFTPGRAR